MSSLREKYLGTTNTTSTNTSLRQKYGLEKDSKYYKNIYEDELKKQKDIRKQIDTNFANQGVQTNTGYFSTQRNILPVQQQSEITKNKKFEVYDNALEKNKEVEQKYQNIKKSDEYKKQEQELIDQSNKVGYAKYDYDKALVEEDEIGIGDKIFSPGLMGMTDFFNFSGGLVKDENGNVRSLANQKDLKYEKLLNSYDDSTLGGKIGKLWTTATYQIGKIGTSTAINQVLPGVGQAMYFGDIFVDYTNNAMKEGYDSGSALVYGAVNTATEILVGKALGSATKGLTGGKSSGYEQLLNKTFNKILNKPQISKILANAGSEATEEFVQEYLDNLTKLAVLEKSTDAKDYKSVFTDEEVFGDAVYSALVGAITGGTLGTVSGQDTNVNNSDVYSTLKTELEQTKKNTTNKETINKIDGIIENINNIQNNNTGNQISQITTQLEEYRNLQEQNKLNEKQQKEMVKLQEQLNTLQNEVNSQNNVATKENIKMPTVNDIVSQEQNSSNINLPSPEINSSRVNLPTVNDLARNSINTSNNTNQSLPARNLTFKESASKYNIDINNDTIKSISNLMSNRGITARFDNNLFNDTDTNAVWIPVTNKNGQIIGREVVFNPNADTNQLLQDVSIHEMYHDIASSGDGNILNDLIQTFNMNIEGFEKARQELAEMYAKKYPNLDQNSNEFQQIVDEEVVASILGKKLGSQEYINRLVNEKPSLARRIYDFVIDKLNQLNKLVGYKNEKIFWEDVKNKFEKAYREEYKANNATNTDSRYMFTGIKGTENAISKDSNNQWLKDNYSKAKQMSKNNITNEQIRQKTGWFQDEKGDWKFEISDEDAKIINKLEKNKTYKLGDILEHNDLFEMYPNLRNNKIKFMDFDTRIGEDGKQYIKRGRINNITNTISLNNDLISKGNNTVLDTLIHEIQHRIQKIEKFEQGTTSANGFENYRNNAGEKEARDTAQRRNLNYETRLKEQPMSSKISNNNKIDNKRNKWYSLDEVERNVQENNSISSQNLSEDIYSGGMLGRNSEGQGLDNSSFSFKQKQLDIILESNPVNDDYHTWIRTVDDIKTFEETLQDSDWEGWEEDGFDPDYTGDMAKEALSTGKITVYSSYPIEQGIFVSPSRMEAESYSGNGKVYSKEVNLTDVVWIDPTQGQYAKVNDTKYSQNGSKWQEYLDKNYKSEGTGQTLQDIKLPVRDTINMPPVENKKLMNPNEISKLSKEEANTTPILPTINVSTGTGESKFASNIEYKTDMLTETSKDAILSDGDVNYYQEVTNQESLNKAFERLNNGGESEVFRWLKNKENINDVDVAEGYILLKQYQDKIENTADLIQRDYYNRSMVQVAKRMREIGTKAGQTVQAFNILNRLTPEGMVYYAQSELSEAFDNMSKNKTKEWIDNNRDKFELTPEETQFIMDTMKEVQQMEDGYDKRVKLAEIQKVMTDKLPPSKGAGIKSWMRISMLFNPKTQVRNVMGNAIIAPVNTFSDLFASVVDSQIAKKTGVRTTGKTSLKNYTKGFKKGAFESYNDFKKGINTRNLQGNRFEVTEGKSFNDNTSIGKALNRVDSLLSFMLDAGDRTFYEATFTNSINNQLVLNNTDVVTQEMIDIATSEALSRTWQDNNNYTKGVLWVRNWLNNVNIKGYGLGDVLIPFAKTPANLTKAIVDYSPAGLVKTVVEGNNLRKALTNGQYTAQMQHQFVQDLGKATAGTMLYVLGYALAKAGVVSGESDDDKDVSNFMKNTLGVSSYSIKIGDKSFTYDWAQPIAAPLSIMANVVNSKNKETALLEGVVSSLDSAGSILLEQSFLESINSVLNDNDGVVSGIINEILELPSRAVPTLMKQIADLVDPVQRTTFEYGKPIESAINSIKAKIPFVSKTLAPSVDTMGREIQKYGGKNNIFNVFLNPANVNTENISKSAEEIYRLYKSTGETNIMPRVPEYKYKDKNGNEIVLNSKQRAEYQKISGEIIENNVEKLLETSEYNNMSDKEKAEVIKNIVNYSYNIAQKEVLDIELSNTYQKAYEYSQIGDISDFYTFKASIDDTDKDTKKESITNYLINCNLEDNQIAVLYGSYYSSEAVLNSLINANIPIKEFIKFNSQEFTTDYYDNGKAVTNSRKNKVINYVNSLNLSIPQKAILIKMEYSSYDSYNSQIVNYINNMNYSKFEKASLLKTFGFDNYDKYLIDHVNSMSISKDEKSEILEELGFTIRNGKVYSK